MRAEACLYGKQASKQTRRGVNRAQREGTRLPGLEVASPREGSSSLVCSFQAKMGRTLLF